MEWTDAAVNGINIDDRQAVQKGFVAYLMSISMLTLILLQSLL